MADKLATRRDLARLGRRVDSRSRSRDNRLEAKMDRVAASLVRTQADVAEIKEDMATKDDFRTILAAVHKMNDEKRINALESSR